jgi:lipoprotein-anchoring transpeptidase ErfK/SrfK
MKKVIRLTESDLEKIVKRVIKEQSKVKPLTPSTNNLKNVNASEQVKKQLQYMKSNNILSNEKFTIVDDVNSKVYEIGPGYKVIKSFFVITGKNKGDELKTKTFQSWVMDNWGTVLSTIYNSKGSAVNDIEKAYFAQDEWRIKNTPSGIFRRAGVVKNWLGNFILTNLAEATYGKRFITWETLDGNMIPFGFHGTKLPKRLPVLNNANEKQKISERKMSLGCINFNESDAEEINNFIDAGQISVWLPDATNEIVQFPSNFSKKQDINSYDKYRMYNPHYTDPGKI